MPNWCNNHITITGPNKIIDRIEKITKEEDNKDGLLQFMMPMPKELRDTTADGTERKDLLEKYGHSDWYGWATDNWGTKWEVCEFYGVDRQHLNDSLDESTISFSFDSAWSPPIGAYENFLAENENCSLVGRYYEGGCDFMGVWDNGDDRCYSCSEDGPKSDSDFYTHGDGKEIDDYFGITESLAEYEAEQESEAEQKVSELVVEKKSVNIGEDA